jgi:MarR family transcriptional regulator, lower aerobic nicotinate degradation pathway regulator
MPDVESLAEIYRRPGFMVKRLHQVATAIFLEECGRYSMTPSQYQALCAIHEHAGIGQRALGKLTGQDRSTISLVVRLLLDRGLIRRVVNADDKRCISLKLSEAGVQTLREVAPAARRAQDRFLSALPQAKRAEFLALLDLLLDRHGEQIDPASVVTGNAGVKTTKPRAR